MRTNFYANVYLARLALPLLARTGGKIIVISSLSGKFGLPSRTAYCASKFALTGFFESLRTETEVPIMMVYPTSLETPMRNNSLIKSSSEGNSKREDPRKCAEVIIKGVNEGV
jgi:dehydrogenase/reductase SDR family protein 7B